MKPLKRKYYLVLFSILLINRIGMCQFSIDTSLVAKNADIIIKTPIFKLDMENFRQDINKYSQSTTLKDLYSNSTYCTILFEVKNQSNKDVFFPRLNIDSYNKEYSQIAPSLLKNGILKAGASVFFLSIMPPKPSILISPLLATVLPKDELKKMFESTPAGGISYSFSSNYGSPYKDTLINGQKSYIPIMDSIVSNYNYISGAQGYFKFTGSLKNSHLFAIDTLVNVKDTVKLKQKYLLHKVINNFYVLHDTAHQNDLLAEFYTGIWKTSIVPIKDIEVQTKNFYYKEQKIDWHVRYQDSINHTIRKSKIIAHITITNHSKQYLYVKKNINKIPNLNYTLSYFGQEAKVKNQTIKALAPNASLIVTILADYETVRKNKSIILNTSQLFLNCPKADYKINFTNGYFID
jgi:hypothetical protein